MLKAQVRPSRDLRNHYADVMKTVDDHNYVYITNQGRGDVVMVDQDYFAELQQLARQQHIYNELQKSKASLDDPSTVLHDAEDVFDRLEQRLTARGL